MKQRMHKRGATFAAAIGAGVLFGIVSIGAQDRLPAMPGADQYARMQPLINGAVVSGAAQAIQWAEDGKTVAYTALGKNWRFDVATKASTEVTAAPAAGGRGRGAAPAAPTALQGGARGGLEQQQSEMPVAPMQGCPPLQTQTARGRQAYCIPSPDSRSKAFFRARNLWVANADGSNERQITRDGSEQARIKYGTGSWVYGEELDQTTAIWWSPDSSKVAFYRFDESQVKDFYVQMQQTSIQDAVDVEAYPKAGAPNPIADVLVYDIAGARSTRIDARDGKPFDNTVVGHYVYGIEW